MKKSLRILTALLIAASSILFASTPTAMGTTPTAMGAPYNGTSGDVACGTSGFFTILNNLVTSHSSCEGSVVIPQGVTSIGEFAFNNADYLTTLTIGDDLTSIGESAFYGADLLTTVTIGSGGTTIGESAFEDADSLTTVTIGSGGTSIGEYAFASADSLTTLTIGSGGTSIGQFAFAGADSLTTLTIGSGPTSIGQFAFNNANSLTSLTIGSGPTSIGQFAFSGADSLTTVTIGSGGTSIGQFAFNDADSLTTVTIGSGGTTIGNFAFSGAVSLTTLTIGSGTTTIGDFAFYNAESLTSLTISSGTTTIGNFAFSGADSLRSLIIPGSVSTIGSLAFYGTSNLLSYRYCGDSYTTEELSDRGLIGTRLPCPFEPTAPTAVVATATGKRSATVSFDVPASDGYSTILSYTATASSGGFTQTLTQATGGTFTFSNLQPGTSYTFSVVATNAIGSSTATTSNSITTVALDVASISTLSFISDGTGTGGKLVWTGSNINSVLYTGLEAAYPGPFKYGTFTSGWNGRIRNLTPDTSYTISITAVSADGVSQTKTLTFTSTGTPWPEVGVAKPETNRSEELSAQLPRLFAWIDENAFVNSEGARMKRLLSRFQAAQVLSGSPYLALPNSRIAKVSATSLTSSVCTVEAGLKVKSISAGTCTISYIVSDASRAPATLVQDFVFRKFAE